MRRRDLLRITAFAPLTLAARPRPPHRLLVHKSERRMELWIGDRLVRRFRVALGLAPVGDKVRQGDRRTPEGRFYLAWKKPNSDFHRFLGLSYPMPRHAARGRARGLISTATEEKILARVRRRGVPPQTSALGGFVGIHGGGAGADWTFGCIAVSDAEVEYLFSTMRRGDVIEVRP